MLGGTFKLTVAYDGTDLAGWQIQPGKRTVQGELERALARIAETRVIVVGSGRTDSGVHARGQVAAAYFPHWPADAAALQRALNGKLPHDISVLDCQKVHDPFHPINDAVGKRYEYRLHCGGPRDPLVDRYAWHVHKRLDVAAMREAARHLVGLHDFRSFQTTGSERKTSVRHVRVLELQELDSPGPGQHLLLGIEADGFLYNMVRNIVGTLVLIGRGKHPPSWIDDVLRKTDRTAAGPTAPPEGLCLVRVDYPPLPAPDATSEEDHAHREDHAHG